MRPYERPQMLEMRRHPETGLWCREDGAVLLPPTGRKFKEFRRTFGTRRPDGYCQIRFRGKFYKVHQLVCRTFHGLAPEGRPFVDHIDRCKANNTPGNLHWTSAKENADNQDRVDQSIEKYGVRACDGQKAYEAAKYAKMKAQGLVKRKGPDGKWGWFPHLTQHQRRGI